MNVCTWGEYIDESLIDRIRGADRHHASTIRPPRATRPSTPCIKMGGADFDVIVPSDYMIARLIEEDMLAELDYDNIPNFEKIDDRFKNLTYRPGEQVHRALYLGHAWASSTTPRMVDEPITSWGAMFDPDSTPGRCCMINNSRDALGIALMLPGLRRQHHRRGADPGGLSS